MQTLVCNRGEGQVSWSVCRTRSETGVKAVRAAGKRGAGGSFTGIQYSAVLGYHFIYCLLANQEPSSLERKKIFFLSAFFGLWSDNTQSKFIFVFPRASA